MSAPPISAQDYETNNNDFDYHSNLGEDERGQLINLHSSLPSDLQRQEQRNGSTRGNTGDFAPDMSLTSFDAAEASQSNQRDSRLQSLRSSGAYVPVNRPVNCSNSTGKKKNQSATASSDLLIETNNINSSSNRFVGAPSGRANGTNANRVKSPFFGNKTGTSSPISSILSSGSKLLQQSMRVINLEPGSLRASTFTVITAMVGGGTLTIPYGVKLSIQKFFFCLFEIMCGV